MLVITQLVDMPTDQQSRFVQCFQCLVVQCFQCLVVQCFQCFVQCFQCLVLLGFQGLKLASMAFYNVVWQCEEASTNSLTVVKQLPLPIMVTLVSCEHCSVSCSEWQSEWGTVNASRGSSCLQTKNSRRVGKG